MRKALGLFLPILALTALTSQSVSAQGLRSSDFEYLGAFAIPDGDGWYNSYGQRGLSFDPTGDPSGSGDGYSGSLWMTGHDYKVYTFEIGIPVPKLTQNYGSLNTAPIVTNAINFPGGACRNGDQVDRWSGVEVHGSHIWGSCSTRYNVTGNDLNNILFRRNADLSNLQGPFHAGPIGVGTFHSNRQGDYLFSIPSDWADTHLGGRDLAVGMHRNSHGGSMGPTMFAFDPANPSDGYDIFWYRHRRDPGADCFEDDQYCDFQPYYAACDYWNGGEWVTSSSDEAVLIGGINCYGGTDYQPGGFVCAPCFGEVLFYDPDDFVDRIAGSLEPWEVLPREVWRPAELWDASASDDGGEGIGGLAYDSANGRLYMVERAAGPWSSAIVHVFSVGEGGTGEYTLTVTKAGAGFGTVTSSPAGIQCGVDCQEIYSQGTTVQLDAAPDNGSYFAGWSGDADCSDGYLSMYNDRNCTATFELGTPPTYTLSISKTGPGSGTVISSPGGIDCGSFCQEDFVQGTAIQLAALPDEGSIFGGWSGSADCTDGQLTMNNHRNCTATFNEVPEPVGLIAAYSLDEGGGGIIHDASGQGNDGTVEGATWTQQGYFGSALSFDGAQDYADLGPLDVVGSGVTLSAWFKADNLDNCSSSDCRILSRATGTDEAAHYFMLSTIRENSNVRLRFRIMTGGVTTTLIASTGNLSNQVWAHAAAVYDGSTMKLYLNGVPVGSRTKNGVPTTSDTVPAWIGGNPPGMADMPWDGLLDEIRVYDRALNQSEIQQDMNTPIAPERVFQDGFESGDRSRWQ